MAKRKRRPISKKKRRQKRIIRLELFLLLLLLGIAAFLYCRESIYPLDQDMKESEEESIEETEVPVQDLTINTEEEETTEASENEDAVPAETANADTDLRRVQNTATEEHHKTNGLSICMYHYVYDENDVPDDLNNNYIEVHALEEELQYLVDNDYFFPTWEEVRQYIDGELLLPEKSVVLTFDDGARSFLNLGSPLFEKYEIPVTSFLITSKDGEEKVAEYGSNPYLSFQSHSDNMHRAGGNIGHGGIFTAMSHDDAVADLQKSIEICGNGDAFAYPYGDYTEDCRTAVEDAGFLCAVTTENSRCNPGDDPLKLPRVRMLQGQSLDSFINLVQ